MFGFRAPTPKFVEIEYIQYVSCLCGVSLTLKVHKRENFLGFDFEICTFS